MAHYAIGDLQGCYDTLEVLLNLIDYQPTKDQLWFCGDLVNRGTKSLECLRFAMQCEPEAQVVLGNHDLHLLAVANGVRELQSGDTLHKILEAPDCRSCLDWLRHRPLMVEDDSIGFCMVHAGIHPEWSLAQAKEYAGEVSEALQKADYVSFLHALYRPYPTYWIPTLSGMERLGCIVNILTRMRYLHPDGQLQYRHKAAPKRNNQHIIPWYRFPGRKRTEKKLLFGHWSTVTLGEEDFSPHHVYPLDTGCIWGHGLRALRLEDTREFNVSAK